MRVEFLSEDRAEVSAYRYDYGQMLEIAGLDLSDGFEVHFQNGTENPEIRQGTVDENNVCTVAVPDVTLSLGYDYVLAWIYVKTPESGTTVKTIVINILPREKPSDAPSVDDYPQIKKYADYVRENAERVSAAEAVADKLKADAATGLFNGKDGRDGADGAKGDTGNTGPQGPPGKDGMRTYLAYTEEEFEIAVEEIFSDFTSKVPASIITMASFFGYSDSENRLLQLYLFDDGTGNPDNAILINSYIFDEALYKTVASQLLLEFTEYEKTYSVSNTFDASVADARINSIKMIAKLPDALSLKQENVPGFMTVRLNGYKDSFSMPIEQNIMDIGYFIAEASIEKNSFIRLRMTLTDSTFNNVIRKEEFFKQVSGYENIERFIFSLSNFNFDANKKYTVNYFGKGGAAF